MDHPQAIEQDPILGDFYAEAEPDSRLIRRLFNDTAADYDRLNRLFSLGSGAWYRRRCLIRAGLRSGCRLIDVAVGTGLLAREAVTITGSRRHVIGIDLSEAMLSVTQRKLGIPLVQGNAEDLPLADACADFVSMGYALRHIADLPRAFREFRRVLRPGGTVLLLEISAPRKPFQRNLISTHFARVVPFLIARGSHRRRTRMLMEYFWDTIENCPPSELILDVLRAVGFGDVQCRTEIGLFCSYFGRKY